MAKETETKKRGPGRPPGSKNKPKNSGSSSSKKSSSTRKAAVTPDDIRQERIARMQAQYDRDRRNVDVIWSITLFAVGLFLFFTVVMDTTGSFGRRIHDICLGLFGIMAYVLPFMVIIFGILLLARKMQHISGRTIVFSILIFLNMCILNSYRFINENAIGLATNDIANYYVEGVDGKSGGVFGMELGSMLVKFFGKPGLIIIAGAILLISVFLVANTPISRFVDNLVKKAEQRRIMREIEEAEAAKVQMAVARTATPGADPYTGIADRGVSSNAAARASDLDYTLVEPAEGKSLWRSILSGITKEEEPEIPPTQREQYAAARQRNPLDRVVSTDKDPAPQPVSTPAQSQKNRQLDNTTLPAQKDDSVMTLINKDTLFGRLAKKIKGSDTAEVTEEKPAEGKASGLPEMSFDDDDDTDYGYRRRPVSSTSGQKESAETSSPAKSDGPKHYGLEGAAEDTQSSGRAVSYGLTGTGTRNTGRGLDGGPSYVSGNAAAAGFAQRSAEREEKRKVRAAQTAADQEKSAAKKPASAPENSAAGTMPAGEPMSDKDAEALAQGFNAQEDDTAYVFPPVSLLKKSSGNKQLMTDFQLEEKANLLEKTLNDFGVDARVLTVTQGASVTRYEVQPATGVKVSSITRLADDIALNLRAKSIRIEAPIPGKAAVGIEVENDKPSPVSIRELIDSEEFREAKSKIEFVVGKDISGNNIVADLKEMPHLLIAGATGSGKSVCINTIIASFLYKAKPSELKLIMVDPKVVELANYNGIPHMLTPVVTDARKATRALAIAVEEMDKRYDLFAKAGVKDLESYNELMRANQEYANCKPQVVIIIDELADLMMAASNEVENSICRLAQKARAAGMHLIVATQRPSVDVVTGLIKANIPSRIAFSVASQVDSRTILDMAGAEKLLGKGDMLFSPVGSSKPFRVQGPYISDAETEKLIKFVKKEGGGPSYDEELQAAIDNPDKKGGSEPQDELTGDAIEFILKSRQASVSMLQRRFRIGYNRAARIIDEIEEKGIIGPSDGSRPRQVLMTLEEYKNGAAAAEPEEVAEEEPVEVETIADSPLLESNIPKPMFRAGHSAEVRIDDPDSPAAAQSAVDYFNSLPESVRRQILDADSHYDD